MSRWYRAYEGTVTDPKLGEAAMMAGVSRSVAIAAWHCLLESAASRNNCGSFDTSARRIAVILCEPPAGIEALFAAFDELGMIGDGAVASWSKRQFQSDDSKERVAKHRAKKRRETATNESGNAGVTPCNGEVTLSYTETETEEEVSNETFVAEPEDSESEEGLVLKPEHLSEAWNSGPATKGAVQSKRMGPKRRRKAISFLRNHPIDDITEAISAVAQSDFLCGRTKEGFRADIEFLFSDTHMNRLLEGFYAR
jgi:hypothetical protein